MKTLTRALLMSSALIAAVPAQAVMVTVEAVGTIYDSFDSQGTFGAAGNDTLIGTQVTATWTFDSEQAPSDRDSRSNVGIYDQRASDWISASIKLGSSGNAISDQTLQNSLDRNDYDRVMVLDDYSGRDQYDIFTEQRDTTRAYLGGQYRTVTSEYFRSSAYFIDYVDDIIAAVSADTTFTWTNDDSRDRGYGYFQLYNRTGPAVNIWAGYELSSMRAFTAEVPEPMTIALLGIGLISLGIARRRQS